eukprot:CAMPEP_0197921226 /NCGR_PEP_ID=MMETSP1439-20131203/90260_1 /TAXON_ID=66791 /ORGANISM="Gonyaulax spinifera, Strain CCMP409" /LENGTH=59 /DNA_ID=CAMNT_0043543469 /DNA_START=51 /DNA_END=227 /DNA_ORIENTATION=+
MECAIARPCGLPWAGHPRQGPAHDELPDAVPASPKPWAEHRGTGCNEHQQETTCLPFSH